MERHSRTWLCSVVFLDIVGYTQRPVAQQIEMKEDLQKLISDALAGVAESDRILVDTGDGAALCFLGDPEEALFVAINLRDVLAAKAERDRTPFTARIGINLGPVKVLKSINGQLNPLGDGINNAQRVMGFAEPNQILVSRSFYDVIACLSQEYSQLFHFVGTRKDKHVKEHAVYEVMLPDKEKTYTTALAAAEQTRLQRQEEPLALTWDPAALATAAHALALYIGPLAKVLVQRVAKQVSTTEELYATLADMIPVDAEREKFLASAPAAATPQAHAPPTASDPEPPEAARPAHAGNEAGSAPDKGSWDPAVLKTVERGLANYLGPLSGLLVRKAAKKCTTPEELYRLLAAELATEEDQNAFLSAMSKSD